MRHSFRLKIGLLSLCLSGLLLLGFGIFAVSVLNHVALERVDRELRALADTQVRQMQPNDHWRRFDESLRSMYGSDASKRFVVKTTHLQGGNVVYATSEWPVELSLIDLPLSLETAPQDTIVGSSEAWVPQSLTDRPPPPRAMRIRGPVYATIGKASGKWRAMTIANEEVTLSIAMNLAELHAETQRFQRALLVGVPLGLLLIAAVGWLIGHVALRPVNRIARTAEAATARRLDERIPDENADEEFTRLIALINGMLERLERSFQQATRFSADAAHELKTPLAILQAQVERSLQRATDGSLEQRECAEQLDEVQRLKSILSKLLLLSRADAGELPLSLGCVNLVELARAAVDDIEMLAPNRRVTVKAPSELLVQGDGDLLTQVVENLISNAVKFGDENGVIEITVEQREESAVLTVANSGRSIPLPDTERIFERFYRVDPSRGRGIEGTGLGLSLAREIAKAHGGDLTLEQSDATTTRFALVLPQHVR